VTKTQTLKDRKDLTDILSGKKAVEELEDNEESMPNLPTLSKPKTKTSQLNYQSCDSQDSKNKEEQKDLTKVPMRRYDHDMETYHMGLYKAKKWDPKIAKKYFSPNASSGRKAPFTLAELRGRNEDKRISMIKRDTNLYTG